MQSRVTSVSMWISVECAQQCLCLDKIAEKACFAFEERGRGVVVVLIFLVVLMSTSVSPCERNRAPVPE